MDARLLCSVCVTNTYTFNERREALIEQLESKLNQKTEVEDLFTIH
jgi:hypothetical protein